MKPLNTKRNTLVLATAVVLLAAGIAFGLTLAGDDATGSPAESRTLEADGFELTYPSDWQEIDNIEFPFAEAVNADQVGEHVVGIDEDNYVVAYSFDYAERLPTRDELMEFGANTLGPVFQQVVETTPGGRLIGLPIPSELAGQPALQVLASFKAENGTRSSYEMNQIFYEGRPGLIIAYVATLDHAIEMRLAFDRMVESASPPES